MVFEISNQNLGAEKLHWFSEAGQKCFIVFFFKLNLVLEPKGQFYNVDDFLSSFTVCCHFWMPTLKLIISFNVYLLVLKPYCASYVFVCGLRMFLACRLLFNILQVENFEKLFTLSIRVTLGFRKNFSGQG